MMREYTNQQQTKMYREVTRRMREILHEDADPSLEKFDRICEVLRDGIEIANQAQDCNISKQFWLSVGLELLTRNPMRKRRWGRCKIEELLPTKTQQDAIVNSFVKFARPLKEWADMAYNPYSDEHNYYLRFVSRVHEKLHHIEPGPVNPEDYRWLVLSDDGVKVEYRHDVINDWWNDTDMYAHYYVRTVPDARYDIGYIRVSILSLLPATIWRFHELCGVIRNYAISAFNMPFDLELHLRPDFRRALRLLLDQPQAIDSGEYVVTDFSAEHADMSQAAHEAYDFLTSYKRHWCELNYYTKADCSGSKPFVRRIEQLERPTPVIFSEPTPETYVYDPSYFKQILEATGGDGEGDSGLCEQVLLAKDAIVERYRNAVCRLDECPEALDDFIEDEISRYIVDTDDKKGSRDVFGEREPVGRLPEMDERIIAAYEGALARLADAQSPEKLTSLKASPCADVLLVKTVEFLKTLMEHAPFYYGKASPPPSELPSETMLSEQVVLGPYCLLMNAAGSADAVPTALWEELGWVGGVLFETIEKIIGGFLPEEIRKQFVQGLELLRQRGETFTMLPKDAMLQWCVRRFRDLWYEVGFELERREQEIADEIPGGPFPHRESREAAMNRIAARKEWYAKYCPNHVLCDSSIKMILGVMTHMLVDVSYEATAFRYMFGEGESATYELDLRVTMGMDTRYGYQSDDDDELSSTLRIGNRWLEKARKQFFVELNDYCERQAQRCPEDGNARRLWYEAMAMLNAGLITHVYTKEETDAFVAKANEAAREAWIETKMYEKEKQKMNEATQRFLCDAMLAVIKDADMALMWDINRGLYSEGPTRLKVSDEKKAALVEDFPHQKGELERMFRQMEERGIKRQEFVLPNNSAMSRALRPFSEEFFGYRTKAGDAPVSPEYLAKMNEASTEYICAWQTFLDDLPNYIDDDALLTRIQNVYEGLYPEFKKRLLSGDGGFDVFEYRNMFNEFKSKLVDVAAVIAAKENGKGRDLPKVLVAGYTNEGRAESVQIANTRMAEKDWFSDPNLRLLFGVSVNTPSNWRHGKGAPDGFAEAFEKKDVKKMTEIAKKYKADRDKGDAMNTKGVERNLSEEQMHRQCLK